MLRGTKAGQGDTACARAMAAVMRACAAQQETARPRADAARRGLLPDRAQAGMPLPASCSIPDDPTELRPTVTFLAGSILRGVRTGCRHAERASQAGDAGEALMRH